MLQPIWVKLSALPQNPFTQLDSKISPTDKRSITRPFGGHSPFWHWQIDPFCHYVLQFSLFFQSLVKRKSSIPSICPPPCYTRRLLIVAMPGDLDSRKISSILRSPERSFPNVPSNELPSVNFLPMESWLKMISLGRIFQSLQGPKM